MIKDPLNTQLTPYDILDLDVNTPMSDIHQALPRFMKKNKIVSKISIAQEAIRRLKNIQDRLAFDITYYAVDVIESGSINSLCDISALVTKQISIPVFNSPDYLSDILAENESNDLPEFNCQPINIDYLNNYHIKDKVDLFITYEFTEHHSGK